MPPIVEIRQVSEHAGQEVILQGWLYNLRESGKLLFPLFRDGTGIIQGVVVKSAVPPEVFEHRAHGRLLVVHAFQPRRLTRSLPKIMVLNS